MANKPEHNWGESFRHIYVIEWYNVDSNQWLPESLHFHLDDATVQRALQIKNNELSGIGRGESDYRIRKYIPEPKSKKGKTK